MPETQRQHHGWTWVTPLRRQASFRQWDRTKLKVPSLCQEPGWKDGGGAGVLRAGRGFPGR